MTRRSDVCFVNVNGVIVDDGSERLLASGLEEKGSTANLIHINTNHFPYTFLTHFLLCRKCALCTRVYLHIFYTFSTCLGPCRDWWAFELEVWLSSDRTLNYVTILTYLPEKRLYGLF